MGLSYFSISIQLLHIFQMGLQLQGFSLERVSSFNGPHVVISVEKVFRWPKATQILSKHKIVREPVKLIVIDNFFFQSCRAPHFYFHAFINPNLIKLYAIFHFKCFFKHSNRNRTYKWWLKYLSRTFTSLFQMLFIGRHFFPFHYCSIYVIHLASKLQLGLNTSGIWMRHFEAEKKQIPWQRT